MTTKITNTQIDALVKAAYAQATGQEGVDVQLDLTAFTEVSKFDTDFTMVREKFTGALIASLAKNFYLDSAYTGDTDPFYATSNEFGAVNQMIYAEVPEVKENSAWDNFVSGTTTIGTTTAYLPALHAAIAINSQSYSLPICISDVQWSDAVRSQEDFDGLVSYIMLAVKNALESHKENLAKLNIVNAIGEAINAQNTNVAGTHAVNLVKEYADSIGETSMTVEDFLSNADALRFASQRIKTYMRYMKKMSTIFNTKGRKTFTPKDRLVGMFLGDFIDRMESKLYSQSFNKDMVELPDSFNIVASWQSLEDITFNGVSSINVKTSEGAQIEKAGIIGILADKWAVMSSINTKSTRVGKMRDDIKALTAYEYQFRHQRINNMCQNFLVLYLDDVVAA